MKHDKNKENHLQTHQSKITGRKKKTKIIKEARVASPSEKTWAQVMI